MIHPGDNYPDREGYRPKGDAQPVVMFRNKLVLNILKVSQFSVNRYTDNPLASLLATSCYTGCSFDDEEEETDMSHYCGIDLHSNNHFMVVIDDEDKRVFEKRLNNDLPLTLEALSPFRESLKGIAVESTFNWYWLVDGLQEQGYDLRLVNTLAVNQYDGL